MQQGIAVIPKSERPHHILENTKVRAHTLQTPDNLTEIYP